MAEPDDPEILPTQAWAESSKPEPAPAVKLGSGIPPHIRSGRWQPPTPSEVQRSFPQYEIVEILGRGGMGAVYKGWQKSLHRFVAIKILPPGAEVEAKNYAERFQREARAMARFQHPNIVAVHDAGETPEGLLFYIMEYIEGTDVQKILTASGRLAPDRALNIATQVCNALAYAHRQGVIHRDVKPSNIMMLADGSVKVADFGLAKLTTDDASLLTGTHVTIGTPDFIAPEAKSGMENVDHRADVYAVGVMLYQMLTGELPRGRFDPPSVQAPGIDVRFDDIVDRAMRRNPEKRYATAIEMRTDLDSILTGSRIEEPASASLAGRDTSWAVSKGAREAKTSKASRSRLFAGLAGLLAAAMIGGVFFARKGNGTTERRAASGSTTGTLSKFERATKDQPLENSLGMKFVPVPISGAASGEPRILFSIWETRVRDYKPFVEDHGVDWPEPKYEEPTQPAVNITLDEALAFCDWLTEHERAAKRIGATERYRLPTDREWSCAVGLGDREDAKETPEQKHLAITEHFPWGMAWPPSAGAGNYGGEECIGQELWSGQQILHGYRDPFPLVAPVGSFAANPFGIFDLGGNVHEWCDDLIRPGVQAAVLRGASFVNDTPENLMSSYRLSRSFDTRSPSNGFRVVLESSSPPAASSPPARK